MAYIRRPCIFGSIPPCGGSSRQREREARQQQLQAERNAANSKHKTEELVLYEENDAVGEIESMVGLAGHCVDRYSFSFVDIIRGREMGVSRNQPVVMKNEYGTRHMLCHGMFKEKPIYVNNMNKVFCSQWLSERQVLFGTKCGKLMALDILTHQLDQIPLLTSSSTPPEQHGGVHSVEINPSRTLLATGGKNCNDIAIYHLPTMDPVYVGENSHNDWVFDTCWLDDEFLVSGGRDSQMALWRVVADDLPSNHESCDKVLPSYGKKKALIIKPCQTAEKVRAMCYNPHQAEVVAISLNGYIHVWQADTFKQKLSKKLVNTTENVCIAVHEDYQMYAVGSKSSTLLIDARTLQAVRKIPSRYSGTVIRSTCFNGGILSIGAAIGVLMFYDLRGNKYMESNMNSGRGVVLKATKGWLFPDEDMLEIGQHGKYAPALYTHCYDASGTRLFAAGGPLNVMTYGNYIGIWQ